MVGQPRRAGGLEPEVRREREVPEGGGAGELAVEREVGGRGARGGVVAAAGHGGERGQQEREGGGGAEHRASIAAYVGGASSRRHMYQDATDRNGRHGAASVVIRSGVGRARSRKWRCMPLRTPRSPTGRTSGRTSANIRNMCTDHGPMPRIGSSIAATSSSVAVGRRAGTMRRSTTWRARSWIAAALAPDSPAPRSCSM